MPSKEAWHNCLLLLRVAPPLLFTVTSFQAMPTNSLALPSPSLGGYQYNKLDMKTFCKQNFFRTNTFCFIWLNVLFVGIVDISFQSAGTGKCATPTRYLSIHFEPLAVSYELFPQKIKENWITSWLNPTVYSSSRRKNSSWVISGKRAAKRPLCSLFRVAGTCYT